jgi:hypothetical protein
MRSLFLPIYNRITSGVKRDAMPLLDVPLEETQTDVDVTSIPDVHIEQPSSTTVTNGHCVRDNATHLRAKLRFFFMSPCWKWHLKRQFPWKAWFQFLKIIIITTQVGFNKIQSY